MQDLSVVAAIEGLEGEGRLLIFRGDYAKFHFQDVYFASGAVSLGTRDARWPVGCFGGAGDAESAGWRITGRIVPLGGAFEGTF